MTGFGEKWAAAGMPPPDGRDLGSAGFAGSAEPEPIPLARARDLPAFPVEVYPAWLRNMVIDLAEFTQTDPSMAGTVALSVLAACCGGRLEVEVRRGWREPTNLFAAVVAAPGERKTPVQTALTRPLWEAERDATGAAQMRILEQQATKDILAEQAAAAKKLAAKASAEAATKAMAEAIAAAKAAEAVTVETLPRFLADDATPEALASLMSSNGGRIALISDEGGIFDTLAGRYSNTPNLDVFLKGHAGSPIRVDRKGRPPEFVAKPALTIGLMVQPAVLVKAVGNDTFRGRGLIARFLFVVAPSKVGHRLVEPDLVDPDVSDAYATTVGRLAAVLAEWTDPAVIALTTSARIALLKYAQTVEDRLREDGDLRPVVDWGNKLVGTTARIAALLHMAHNHEDGWRRPIDEESVSGAIRLADFFAEHYLAAADLVGVDPVTEDARHLLEVAKRIAGVGAEPAKHAEPQPGASSARSAGSAGTFSVRELFNKVQSRRFARVADLDPGLKYLEEFGHIALVEQVHKGPGRPPSPRYRITQTQEES